MNVIPVCVCGACVGGQIVCVCSRACGICACHYKSPAQHNIVQRIFP